MDTLHIDVQRDREEKEKGSYLEILQQKNRCVKMTKDHVCCFALLTTVVTIMVVVLPFNTDADLICRWFSK